MKLPQKILIAAICLSMPMTLSTFSNLEAKKKDKGNGNGNSGGGNSGGGNSGGGQIGDASGNTVTNYHLDEWNVRGDYEIVGPTVMVIDGDLDIGNNTITITSTGSLELYVGGNINATGRGSINNTGVPSQLVVLGTHPEKQATDSPDYSWTLSGNGSLTGVVYAPNAEYRTNGGGNAGQTSGSVVALDIRFNGSPGPFHFDEALKDLDLGLGDYSLSTYELKANGDSAASEKGEIVFGSSDYKSLFEQLF
ncbi:hypothetical protein DDZ13_04845 [Coraliomargarita sinensis]|uniref:DUF7305 domain-containing protein n=1 Tax=Coraliomargarita sinensis TaxID=2174842 RepID=A0A317ZG36_9BACT|nr:hypothetical protein [Coraliomargarita sinensis]PXA04506.1 hypothetical protein DDZ13_04845 [Coraliomargarita sinensis]